MRGLGWGSLRYKKPGPRFHTDPARGPGGHMQRSKDMKFGSVTWLGVFGSFAMVSGASATTHEDDTLAWLEGCWQHENGTTKEIWDREFDGLLFGRSVTIAEGELKFFEDIRIERRGPALVYTVSPNGSAPVEFVASQQAAGIAVFENEDHDFPQRIRYAQTPSGLRATISDIAATNLINFEMRPCSRG